MIRLAQDLDLLAKEVASLFKHRNLSPNSSKQIGIYQAPIQGTWYNSGDFYPGVNLNDRHQKGHDGIDMRAPGGTEIFPMASGTVTKIGIDPKGGNAITIQHADNIKTYYAHLGTIRVQLNQQVDLDTVIGTVGNSGNAKGTSPHIHFQVWKNNSIVSPRTFFSVPKYTNVNKKIEQEWLSPEAKQEANSFHLQTQQSKTKKAFNQDIERLIKIINTLF